MVSASGALLGTPPCSPRAPRDVTSYSATSGLPQPCPALLPARSLAALGGARGCPVSLLERGRCSPAWGQLGLGRHWGGEQPGVRVGGWGLPSPRTGWGLPGDGSVLAQRGLDVAVTAVAPTGQLRVLTGASALSTGGAGGAECGVGVATPGQEGPPGCWSPWSDLAGPGARGCREDVGLLGGQRPLLGADLEAEEEEESSQN